MEKSIKIITPSYKRSNNVKAVKLFEDNLIIAVHEFEVDEYKKNNKNNQIMEIPNDLRGNMGKVRNFIRNNANCDYLVMIDDDVEKIGYHERMVQNNMKLKEILDFIRKGYEICEEVGTILWGINLQSDPKFYREYSPMSFLSPVLGPFSCHILKNKNIQYDEKLGLNEDYDFALQVLRKYKKIYRNNKYYYVCGHLKDAGGCGAYRLLDEEKKQAELMIKKWGSKVVRYDFNKSTNPIINVPIKGI